jgi:RHS repeat-associated protein
MTFDNIHLQRESRKAQIMLLADYFPFGMIMPGRSYNSTQYRYGFGGMEKDDEIAGSGNSYTAEYWQYDPRLGRRWNVDPITYPWQSSYAAFNNNPIYFTDPLGLQGDPPTGGGGGGLSKAGDPFTAVDGSIHYTSVNESVVYPASTSSLQTNTITNAMDNVNVSMFIQPTVMHTVSERLKEDISGESLVTDILNAPVNNPGADNNATPSRELIVDEFFSTRNASKTKSSLIWISSLTSDAFSFGAYLGSIIDDLFHYITGDDSQPVLQNGDADTKFKEVEQKAGEIQSKIKYLNTSGDTVLFPAKDSTRLDSVLQGIGTRVK